MTLRRIPRCRPCAALMTEDDTRIVLCDECGSRAESIVNGVPAPGSVAAVGLGCVCERIVRTDCCLHGEEGT